MRILTGWTGLTSRDRGASAAIGNFDGVHLGHQAVIDIARARADTPDTPLGIVTFEPHPREFFAPQAPAFRLMNAGAKAHRMEKLGVRRYYQLPFDHALASLEAEEFARHVLHEGLGLRHVVVGADFCFGKGRKGTARQLQDLGRSLGFGVTVAPLLAVSETEISSTSIRKSLSEGRPRDAARMLGHRHRIEGEVLHGEKRGRDLGFPTANMSLQGLHLPRFGVYAVQVDVLDGEAKGSYLGAASIGTRPMFGENIPNLETYLLDFEGDLYGRNLSVALVEFLRPELKFPDVDALIEQMNRDCAEARAILAGSASA
ncbi:bifunctional riboflavin kinase/FAD synthetase [Brevirhabdus sp.]|uniref:bifunctional riboflavin kinase/FAD synthetase n=1 Tax=Brevirhabdus sp. TaxID=2004514 RepID=UPI00405A16A8